MKKFLSVLLALSVVFTYSFGAVFADTTTYTASDWKTAFEGAKTNQLALVTAVKNSAVGSYTYDKDGNVTSASPFNGFNKKAVEAAAEVVYQDADKAMKDAIEKAMSAKFDVPGAPATTTDAPDLTVVSTAAADYVTVTDYQTKMAAGDALKAAEKLQATLAKAAAQAVIDSYDRAKYNAVDKKYDKTGAAGTEYTAAALIDMYKSEASDALNEIEKTALTDNVKISQYGTAVAAFKAKADKVKTLADEEFEAGITAGTVEAAASALVNNWVSKMRTATKIDTMTGTVTTVDLSAEVAAALKDYWKADSGNKGTLFGVAIADITKVTKAENLNVLKAITDMGKGAIPALVAYADGKADNLPPGNTALVDKAIEAAKVVADVKAWAAKAKTVYLLGSKMYNDEAVDKALPGAEKKVYADIGKASFQYPEKYMEDAAADLKISLVNKNEAADKFDKAIEDAQKKMYADNKVTATTSVKYGNDATPAEDYVYLKETYADNTGWKKIADKAYDDLDAAQSYDEIKSIMSKAAADFGKLLKAADKEKVEAAQKSAIAGFNAYVDAKKLSANPKNDAAYEAARTQGLNAIDEAVTEAEVKAAYDAAMKAVDSLKSPEELAAAKAAMEKQIGDLPYTAMLTTADAGKVDAAVKAYDAYKKTPGVEEPSNLKALQDKLEKVQSLQAEELDKKVKALQDKLDKCAVEPISDADIAAMVAMKDEADALKKEMEAFNEKAEEDADVVGANAQTVDTSGGSPIGDIQDAISKAKMRDLAAKVAKAMLDNATAADVKAALDAYNNLTEREQAEVISSLPYGLDLRALNTVMEKAGNLVKQLKITAASKRAKGSITVTWKVKGEKAAADGYQVWRSTKKNKGFTKFFTTKKLTYKNTKSLKKGKTYYYKVRAYKEINGKKVYSDWSNKAFRKAI